MKPLISAQQILEIEQETATIKALIPNLIEDYKVKSKIKREKFNALINEGFTEEQAMQIIIAAKNDIVL